jgi:hypothetical protein
MKRKKGKAPGLPAELRKQSEETQRLLATRIAYHRAKIEEERAQRAREAG